MGTSSSVQHAIAHLYRAFADVDPPKFIDGCSCCIDRKEISALLSKPLMKLSPDDLSAYSASVFLTIGSVNDFEYFLPRILDILASELGWWPSPEVVGRAINTSGFHSWPNDRQGALMAYLDAVITDLLAENDSGFEMDAWICAIAQLHLDLAPFLARIAANGPRLIEFYERNSASLIKGRLANGFWDDAPEEAKHVIDWFQSDEIQKAVTTQYGLN